MRYISILFIVLISSCSKKREAIKIHSEHWIVARCYDTIWEIKGHTYYKDKGIMKSTDLEPKQGKAYVDNLKCLCN